MLYQIDQNNPALSKKEKPFSPDALGITEKHIEDLFASKLLEIIPEDKLMLIGQERQWQEEADLYALDKKGDLYIFELKRWKSNPENLLQVMRYGQIFGQYNYEKLQDLARRHQKLQGELREKHKEYFDLEVVLSEGRFNTQQVFVVVTNGVDRDTIAAIRYWKTKGLRIDSLTYRLYRIGGAPYIFFNKYAPDLEDPSEEDHAIYVVNTNVAYMDDAWREMLEESKAAAYYGKKYAVAVIPERATVYLYHSRTGIIAKGKAKAAYKIKNYRDDLGEEYYVPLDFEWALKDPTEWQHRAVKAGQINQKLNSGHRFRQTAFSISEEMAKAIDELWGENKIG